MDVHKPLRLFQVSRGIFFFDRCLVTDPWPQRTGCDNWSWPRWHWSPRTGAHAFLSWPMKQAYHSNTQKKDSLSQQLSLLKKILYKYGNAFKSHLSHLPVIVVGWKGYEIWVGQNDHCTELIYYIVMFLDVYINSTAWSACGFVFV